MVYITDKTVTTFIIWSSTLISFLDAITNRYQRSYGLPIRAYPHPNSVHPLPDWEAGLREATFLALLKEHRLNPSLRGYLVSAPLIGRQDNVTPFGDIAIIARGQLYSARGGFQFVQDPYQNDCDGCHNLPPKCGGVPCEIWRPVGHERLLALWKVKRIRHRDPDYGLRYELEYTISPMTIPPETPIATRNGQFDYNIPGHTFVVKVDPRTASVKLQSIDSLSNKISDEPITNLQDSNGWHPIVSHLETEQFLPPPRKVQLNTGEVYYKDDENLPRKPTPFIPSILLPPEPPPYLKPTRPKNYQPEATDPKEEERILIKNLIQALTAKALATTEAPLFPPDQVTEAASTPTTTPFNYIGMNQLPTSSQPMRFPTGNGGRKIPTRPTYYSDSEIKYSEPDPLYTTPSSSTRPTSVIKQEHPSIPSDLDDVFGSSQKGSSGFSTYSFTKPTTGKTYPTEKTTSTSSSKEVIDALFSETANTHPTTPFTTEKTTQAVYEAKKTTPQEVSAIFTEKSTTLFTTPISQGTQGKIPTQNELTTPFWQRKPTDRRPISTEETKKPSFLATIPIKARPTLPMQEDRRALTQFSSTQQFEKGTSPAMQSQSDLEKSQTKPTTPSIATRKPMKMEISTHPTIIHTSTFPTTKIDKITTLNMKETDTIFPSTEKLATTTTTTQEDNLRTATIATTFTNSLPTSKKRLYTTRPMTNRKFALPTKASRVTTTREKFLRKTSKTTVKPLATKATTEFKELETPTTFFEVPTETTTTTTTVTVTPEISKPSTSISTGTRAVFSLTTPHQVETTKSPEYNTELFETTSLPTTLITHKTSQATSKSSTTKLRPKHKDDDLFDSPEWPELTPKPIKHSTIQAAKDIDDIFGVEANTQAKVNTKRDDDLFDPTESTPKVIYSNFYIPEESIETTEANEVTNFDDNISNNYIGENPPTQQSFSTSISVEVGTRNRSLLEQNREQVDPEIQDSLMELNERNGYKVYKAVRGEENNEQVTENLNRKELDYLALSLVNHAKSIDYLNSQKGKSKRSEYFKNRRRLRVNS